MLIINADFTAEDLAALAHETNHEIGQLLLGHSVNFEVGRDSKVYRRISSTFKPQWEGDCRAMFRMAVVDVLVAEGRRIAICEQCGELFVKRKRALFCSPACSERGRRRRYVETHRKEISERRHGYYKKLVASTKGKAVANLIRRRGPVTRSPGSESP